MENIQIEKQAEIAEEGACSVASNTRAGQDCPSAVRSSRRRVGKVARLRNRVRELVNQKILDGVPYAEIVSWLASEGHGEFSVMAISRWVDGGYRDWVLRRERRADRLQRSKEMAAEVARMRGRNRNAFAQMNHVVVAEQLNEVLEGLDTEFLLGKAKKDPAMFFRLVRAVNSQFLNEVLASRAEAEVRKLRSQEREKKAARRAARTPKRGGVTEEELERITERMNL